MSREWRPRSLLVVFVALTVLCTSMVACSDDDDSGEGGTPDATVAQVVDGKPTSVRSAGGVVVSIPADGATSGTLSIRNGEPHGESTEDGRESGEAIEVTLDGGELIEPATIAFPVAEEHAAALPVVERLDESVESWRLVPTEDVEIGEDSIVVRTDHFSWYRPTWLSVDRLASGLREAWFAVFGDGLAGASPPSCPRDAETLGAFEWVSSQDDTLFWCTGTNDDGTVVANVVNNNRYPVALDVSPNMVQLGKFGGSWSAEALGAAFDEWGSGEVVLEPREGVTFRLADGTSGSYELSADFTLLTWAIGMLGLALSTYVSIWTSSGTDIESAQQDLAFAVAGTACLAELGRQIQGDPAAWTAARALLIGVFGCAGDVFAEAVRDSGWLARYAGLVASFVAGPVVGAFEGLVALGEIGVDTLASRATYDLALVGLAPSQVSCREAASSGDVDQMAALAVEAINSGDYSLVEDCAGAAAIESLRSFEYARPLSPPSSCQVFEVDLECWTTTQDGFTISIDINSGSAGEIINGASAIGGGL